MSIEQKIPFYGEIVCQHSLKPCKNNAYYSLKKQNKVLYVCGVHSRSCKDERKELEKDPDRKEKLQLAYDDRNKEIKKVARINKNKNRKGNIILQKMRMMRTPNYIQGYMNIFPNYLHGKRKDGLGLPELSPKYIGPIEHGQPNLPIALNLENFHQFNKCFESEVDKKGNPLPIFFKTQREGYLDEIPHRHKQTATGNAPLFSIWVTSNGEKKKMTYIESRQFYCTFYERAVKHEDSYIKLKDMVKSGYNICICGYDAYPLKVENGDIEQIIEECYLDASKPFGHELVLYSMLMLKKNQYPWRKYKTEDF